MSEAKRWLLGGYNHGHYGNLPHPVATEMAFDIEFLLKGCIKLVSLIV